MSIIKHWRIITRLETIKNQTSRMEGTSEKITQKHSTEEQI
jgi:hypothetical protein